MFEILALFVLSIIVGLIISQLTKGKDVSLDRKIEDKIDELPEIYKNAQKNIKIATDFDEKFFTNEKVRSALKKASEKGVEVRIISEGAIPEGYEKVGEIRSISKLKQHMMIIDSVNVRLEKPHERGKFGTEKGDAAFIFKGFPELGEKTEKVFDALWNSISHS